MPEHTLPLTILTGLFSGCLIMAGVHGVKLVELGPFMFDGGLLIYAITFVITDIVSETYGKDQAIRVAKMGFFALIGAFIMTQFSMFLPASGEWETAKEYGVVLGTGSRVFLAAITSYIISQSVDLTVFSHLKRKTNGKHFWLRNNASTIAGGALDAVIFTTIAFYGVFPVLPIIAAAFTVRVFFSIVDTPLIYGILWLLKKSKKLTV